MDSYSDFIHWFNGLSKEEQKEIKNQVKNSLVESGKYETWRNCMFAQNSKMKSETYGTDFFKKYEVYLGVELDLNPFELKMCKQIYDSNRARVSRLKKKLTHYLTNYDCLWFTLTFTDEVLKKTSYYTRRDYIARYCKSLGCDFYVANIDYGDKDKNPYSKEREHYHAVSTNDFIDLSSYAYGYIFVEKIKKGSSVAAISKYINKLTSHAYKDSTKGRDRLIYSR